VLLAVTDKKNDVDNAEEHQKQKAKQHERHPEYDKV
jgi:hypothetical protein